MDFQNTAQVAQAIYWTALVFLFFHGYQVGNRLV